MLSKIAVATENVAKIKAIREGFEEMFGGAVIIDSFESKSNVSEQPLNEEVYDGAVNRIQHVKNQISYYDYDYLVACEAGIVQLFGKSFNSQIVVIEQVATGNEATAFSQGYEIPEELVEKALQTSVAEVLDNRFKGKGGIRVLTNSLRKRENLVKEATIMALSKFNW